MIERDIVLRTVRTLLERDPASEESIRYWMDKPSLEAMVEEVVSLKEYQAKLSASLLSQTPSDITEKIRPVDYFRPPELRRGSPENKKILIIGTCLVEPWPRTLEKMYPSCSADHIIFNNMSALPDLTKEKINEYDFQVLSIPTRFLLPDSKLLRIQYMNPEDRTGLIKDAKHMLNFFMEYLLKYNKLTGIETFFVNFFKPQGNPLGRLFPKNDESNLMYIYDELNKYLEEQISSKTNCYLFDIDTLASAFGKRFIFDDMVGITSHGGFLADHGLLSDANRIEIPVKLSSQQEFKIGDFLEIIWAELFAAHGTLVQENSIKILITDLDDTLWRGIVGETDVDNLDIEGWPRGYIEALLVLKQRGIILGIISKNTKEVVEKKWDQILKGTIKLSDFAITRINWKTKAENMAEILSEVNLLPGNVLYIDDNPVERNAITTAFPGIRTLGANPYSLKRVLLWSAETQVPVITAESSKRTEMIQAQVKRNEDMGTMSRETFLNSLGLKISLDTISNENSPKFQRGFELINKTNQFNTTGKRWSATEIRQLFEAGGFLVTFNVADKYTNYGLVGVLIVRKNEIMQFVMSCRVIGLDVETAVVRAVSNSIHKEHQTEILAHVLETPANVVCRDVFGRSGFERTGDRWILRELPGEQTQSHISIDWPRERATLQTDMSTAA